MRRPIIDLDKLNDLARIRIDWSQADDDEPDTDAPPLRTILEQRQTERRDALRRALPATLEDLRWSLNYRLNASGDRMINRDLHKIGARACADGRWHVRRVAELA